MCELRCDVNAIMATRQQRPLLVQRLRSLLEDEWSKQAAHQTQTTIGEGNFLKRSNDDLTRKLLFCSRRRGARVRFAPIVGQPKQRCGAAITTASPFATRADSTTSCIT